MFVGSTIGGLVPELWGANMLSMWSVVLAAVGGFIGVWAGFRLANM